MAVENQRQGLGIGRALLEAAIAEFQRAHVCRVWRDPRRIAAAC
jgi:GNAT superfamily N-acetyltransferase